MKKDVCDFCVECDFIIKGRCKYELEMIVNGQYVNRLPKKEYFRNYTGLIKCPAFEGIVKNATFAIEDNRACWFDGTWKNGTWHNGKWFKGTWLRGSWKDGDWYDGVWNDGAWYSGHWHGGNWHNGYWKKGTWFDGIWHDGTWRDGYWYSGIWKKGDWKEGHYSMNDKLHNFETVRRSPPPNRK